MAELIEEASGDGRHERDRQKDDDQRKRGGEDGEADVSRRLPSAASFGSIRFSSMKRKMFFQNHDRIVDDYANHQHERQHGDAVQREVQRARIMPKVEISEHGIADPRRSGSSATSA